MIDANQESDGGLEEQTRFGNYEIVRPIGKGKFAIVYRAKRLDNNEIVALKRINVDLIDDKTKDKCLKEVNLLQSLDHPNIIKYFDSFITDHDLVIVVEWAAAGDLKRQLRKAQEKNIPFEERIIWKYFSQICDAIQHMHDKRIMHRDLKPANIFLTVDGTIKVGDLGLSRELSENTIQAHSKVGTPLYMSPEVLKGNGYDFKSDIWSLGCLLYELAVLKSPFKSEGLKLYALFQKISQGDYQPITEEYSLDLRNLAYSLMSIVPEDRPDIAYICEFARKMRFDSHDKFMKLRQVKLEKAKLINSAEINRSDSEASSIFPNLNQTVHKDYNSHISVVNNNNMKSLKSNFVKEDIQIKKDTFSEDESDDKNDETLVKISHVRNNNNNENTSKTILNKRQIKFNSNNDDIDEFNENKNRNSQNSYTNNDTTIPDKTKPINFMESSAIGTMDSIYSKLILLNFPITDTSSKKSILLPFHFAVNLSSMKSIAGVSRGDQINQFFKFVEVVLWLFDKFDNSILKLRIKSINVFNDSSISISKQLLGLVELIGINDISISDITPSSLCAGYGISVCNFLLCLVDCTLAYCNIQPESIIYPDNIENIPDEEDDVDEIEEESQNEILGKKDDNRVDNSFNEFGSSGSMENILANSMIISNIDPILWRDEVERVTPKLSSQKVTIGLSDGWIGRLITISKHSNTLNLSIHPPSSGESVSVLEVSNVSKEIQNTLELLNRNENLINLNQSYTSYSNEYALFRKELDNLREKSLSYSKTIETLTSSLSDLEYKQENLLEEYNNKISDDNDQNGTGRLQRIKTSIIHIKEEIMVLTLTIGIKDAMLLRLRQIKAVRRQKLIHYKNMKRKDRNKQIFDNDDNLDTLSDNEYY